MPRMNRNHRYNWTKVYKNSPDHYIKWFQKNQDEIAVTVVYPQVSIAN